MKKIEVFEGNSLSISPIIYPTNNPKFAFLGTDRNGSDTYIPLDENLLSRHLLLLGGIGTGKTNTFIQLLRQFRQNINSNDVAIIFDTKGDFYKEFYRPGDIVLSNDNLATGDSKKDYWNIFNEIENDEQLEENVIEISKSLFSEKFKNTSQPFFPNAAKDIFGALLTHFIKTNNISPNNKTFKEFLDKSPTEEIRNILMQYDEFKSMISYIFDDRSPQTQGVISELQQASREIFIGNFKKEGTLSMRNIIRNKGGKFIFIEYDLGIGKMLSPIYTLLFDMAIKEALCRKKSEGNVYFIVDEFSLLPNLQHIDDAINFGRSLGVKFMIGIQNASQIFENYGTERAKSIMSGFLTSISFRVNDVESKNYIQELHGKNRKKEIFMASVQGRGIIEQLRDGNVIEDWDITRLDIGEAIIGFPGTAPFLFKFKKI